MPQFQALQDLHVEERVLLVVRRHRLMLWRRGWPGVAFLTALCLLAGAVNYVGAQPILSVLGPLMVIVGVWLVWVWADWQADALVLTDRRLLLIERSPFIREHRWEAHLLNIENVSAVSRGPFSQLLGCSDLVLDTASRGVQRFEFVARANDTAAAIIEVQSHAARRAMRLKRARRNAGLHTRRAAPDPSPWTTLVWRRHIWKVVLASAMPLALLIVASMIASGLPIPWLGIAGGAAALGWEAWILIDWRNDEIVSGPEKVVQTRRRPFMFGEESWQAHLDKVQDVSYLIPNFWAHFLDYGTVTILTAGDAEDMAFAGLPHPREISAELNRRVSLFRIRRQQELMTDVERTIHEVLDMYGLLPDDGAPQRPSQRNRSGDDTENREREGAVAAQRDHRRVDNDGPGSEARDRESGRRGVRDADPEPRDDGTQPGASDDGEVAQVRDDLRRSESGEENGSFGRSSGDEVETDEAAPDAPSEQPEPDEAAPDAPSEQPEPDEQNPDTAEAEPQADTPSRYGQVVFLRRRPKTEEDQLQGNAGGERRTEPEGGTVAREGSVQSSPERGFILQRRLPPPRDRDEGSDEREETSEGEDDARGQTDEQLHPESREDGAESAEPIEHDGEANIVESPDADLPPESAVPESEPDDEVAGARRSEDPDTE